MSRRYAAGRRAWGICALSGIRMLRKDMVVNPDTGTLVHPAWADPVHPQELVEPIEDAIAIHRPAPDPDPSTEIPPETAVFGESEDDFR